MMLAGLAVMSGEATRPKASLFEGGGPRAAWWKEYGNSLSQPAAASSLKDGAFIKGRGTKLYLVLFFLFSVMPEYTSVF